MHVLMPYSPFKGAGISLCFVSTFGVIPHYFERRIPVAYAGIGLGTGIGLAAQPSITAAALDIFGFRNGLLCLSVHFVIPVISAVIFKPQQMPKEERIGSARQLCASYNQSWKHFVTDYYWGSAIFIQQRTLRMCMASQRQRVDLEHSPFPSVLDTLKVLLDMESVFT